MKSHQHCTFKQLGTANMPRLDGFNIPVIHQVSQSYLLQKYSIFTLIVHVVIDKKINVKTLQSLFCHWNGWLNVAYQQGMFGSPLTSFQTQHQQPGTLICNLKQTKGPSTFLHPPNMWRTVGRDPPTLIRMPGQHFLQIAAIWPSQAYLPTPHTLILPLLYGGTLVGNDTYGSVPCKKLATIESFRLPLPQYRDHPTIPLIPFPS